MKRFYLLILVLILALPMTALAAAEEQEVFISLPYHYILLEDGTAEIVRYVGGGATLNIPDTLDGHPVTSIGDLAFSGRDTLNAVTVPEGITYIGHYAFSNCVHIRSITLPRTLTDLGYGAFYRCERLETVDLPDSLTGVGVNPFRCCSKLRTINVSPDNPVLAVVDGVLFDRAEGALITCPIALGLEEYTIPEGTITLGTVAFENCRQLRRVVFPDSLQVLGENPFSQCTRLTELVVSPEHPVLTVAGGVLLNRAEQSVVCCPQGLELEAYDVPEGVTLIDGYAFHDCRSLQRVTLPQGVETIGYGAFSGCRGLREINLPEGLGEIMDEGFYDCRSLTALQLPGSLEAIGKDAFCIYDSRERTYKFIPGLTLTAPGGSWADAWIRDNGLAPED